MMAAIVDLVGGRLVVLEKEYYHPILLKFATHKKEKFFFFVLLGLRFGR